MIDTLKLFKNWSLIHVFFSYILSSVSHVLDVGLGGRSDVIAPPEELSAKKAQTARLLDESFGSKIP